MNEVELIQNFKEGKRAAFKQIYDLNYKALWSYASRITSDKAIAEDVISVSFVKTWERREKFDNLTSVLSFLYVVTRNACFDILSQSKRRRISHMKIEDLSATSEDVIHSELVRAELLQLIMLEAEKLPPKMYEAFKLIYIEGLTLPKTAERLGVTINTIKTQKASFMKKLRKALIKKGISREVLILLGL